MKKRVFIAAVVVIVLSLCVYGSAAYFTASDIATNVITTADFDVEIKEQMLDDRGTLVDFRDQLGVLPGADVSKIVTAVNHGSADAWVRIRLVKEVRLAEGVTGSPDLSLIRLNLNSTDWEEKDGWFYCRKALKPGEETPPLFTVVHFDEKMDNMYMNSTVTIDVVMQSTQNAHNGDSATEAAGWPA